MPCRLATAHAAALRPNGWAQDPSWRRLPLGAPPPPQAQFYAHGLGMNPSERRARLGMAVVMEAAVLLALAAEYSKCAGLL